MAASKSPRIRLLHIRDEIDGIAAVLEGMSFVQYRESYALRRAAERAVKIISEAAAALPAQLIDRHPSVPWSALQGIGNILRHEYQRIEDETIWETVHLPQLRPVIVTMLAEFER